MGVWARGPAAYMKAVGSTAYYRHVGEGVQLCTVDMWGRGPAAYSGYMGAARGPAAYSGYTGREVQLFIVGTWGEKVAMWAHGGRV